MYKFQAYSEKPIVMIQCLHTDHIYTPTVFFLFFSSVISSHIYMCVFISRSLTFADFGLRPCSIFPSNFQQTSFKLLQNL